MKVYKTFFIESKQQVGKNMNKYTTFYVDGVGLSNELEALLFTYGEKGYELHSFQPISGGKSSYSTSQGIIVVLQKEVE